MTVAGYFTLNTTVYTLGVRPHCKSYSVSLLNNETCTMFSDVQCVQKSAWLKVRTCEGVPHCSAVSLSQIFLYATVLLACNWSEGVDSDSSDL